MDAPAAPATPYGQSYSFKSFSRCGLFTEPRASTMGQTCVTGLDFGVGAPTVTWMKEPSESVHLRKAQKGTKGPP